MFKRVLIAVVVVAMLSASVQAGHVKQYDWPRIWIYECLDICDIPVYMKIGMYIEILNQSSLKITLQQMEWKKYHGCTTIKIKSNFDAELSCKFVGNGAVPGDYSCSICEPLVPATLSDTVAEREVCVEGKNVEIVHAQPTNKLRVGTVTICVKPAA
jgi:hypothetical protein